MPITREMVDLLKNMDEKDQAEAFQSLSEQDQAEVLSLMQAPQEEKSVGEKQNTCPVPGGCEEILDELVERRTEKQVATFIF